ncbi:hypothetical protein E3N88_19990 [Mikania micrantha]|uniref:CCHC-type domain-containing protein n=1 Tax=Mikania micrantha TaxID=192012 RepID=A0A5N6NIJ5_9ASTR|nr:hypothetical protein E3N88_19990 [Mikania micrantha]
MVPTLEKLIDRYVGGLPTRIQSLLLTASPVTLKSAITLSAKLTDVMVASGALKKDSGKAKEESSRKPDHHTKKKQKVIKNYTMATPLTQVAATPHNPTKKQYTGTFPLCAKCQYHHTANTPCKHFTGCGRKGHWVQHCRMAPAQTVSNVAFALPPPNNPNHNTRGCYNCGGLGRFSRNCPKKIQPAVQAPRGRAFALGAPAARQDPNVVTSTFLLHEFYASVLFDTGAEQSFISSKFACKLSHSEELLDSPYLIEVADGKQVTVHTILRNCPLMLNNQLFTIDSIPMEWGSFDIIIGMGWLSLNRVEIIYYEKLLRIPMAKDQVLEVRGDQAKQSVKIISCLKARMFLKKQ